MLPGVFGYSTASACRLAGTVLIYQLQLSTKLGEVNSKQLIAYYMACMQVKVAQRADRFKPLGGGAKAAAAPAATVANSEEFEARKKVKDRCSLHGRVRS